MHKLCCELDPVYTPSKEIHSYMFFIIAAERQEEHKEGQRSLPLDNLISR